MSSIMSTTGRRTVGWQSPQLLPMLVAPRKPGREAYVQSSSAMWKVIGSPGFPTDADTRRRRAEETFDRGFDASGVMRQMLAIVTQPNRTAALRSLGIPALVIHGSRTRWCTSRAVAPRPPRCPAPSCCSSRGWGTTCPRSSSTPSSRRSGVRPTARAHPYHVGDSCVPYG